MTDFTSETTLYGSISSRRVTIRDLQTAKQRGERWPMLTAYDYSTARIFDDAGIPVLLVGDSAANVVYGYDTTVPVTWVPGCTRESDRLYSYRRDRGEGRFAGIVVWREAAGHVA